MRTSAAFYLRLLRGVVAIIFAIMTVWPDCARAQAMSLPAPGSMVFASPSDVPVMMKGLKIHPENPLLFDFILDTGKSGLNIDGPEFRAESENLIKYFLTSLALKDDDQWVNLSPYEKDRMMPEDLGGTAMGRDMLAQDYLLKQLTASLIYPEKDLGQKFWQKVYAEAYKQFGTTDIPVDTFNKVWITADKAKVLERHDAALVVGGHLKVMLESDYLAESGTLDEKGKTLDVRRKTRDDRNSNEGNDSSTSNIVHLTSYQSNAQDEDSTQALAKNVLRDVVIPAIEQEVNEGQNFSQLRQIFYAMILATWYKQALKNAFLNQVYAQKSKINGLEASDSAEKERIYAQYLEAFKKGAFNYIKEEMDGADSEVIPRKYFSGGLDAAMGIPKVLARITGLEEGDVAEAVGSVVNVRTDIQQKPLEDVPSIPERTADVLKTRFPEITPLIKLHEDFKGKSGGEDQGYHRYDHEWEVTDLAYRALESTGLEEEDLRAVVMAALFHDFDERSPDQSPSVAKTLAQIEDFREAFEVVGVDLNIVKLLILRTDFPFSADRQKEYGEGLAAIQEENRRSSLRTAAEWLQIMDKIASYVSFGFDASLERARGLYRDEWDGRLGFTDQEIGQGTEKFMNFLASDPLFETVMDALPEWARENWNRNLESYAALGSQPETGSGQADLSKVPVPVAMDDAMTPEDTSARLRGILSWSDRRRYLSDLVSVVDALLDRMPDDLKYEFWTSVQKGYQNKKGGAAFALSYLSALREATDPFFEEDGEDKESLGFVWEEVIRRLQWENPPEVEAFAYMWSRFLEQVSHLEKKDRAGLLFALSRLWGSSLLRVQGVSKREQKIVVEDMKRDIDEDFAGARWAGAWDILSQTSITFDGKEYEILGIRQDINGMKNTMLELTLRDGATGEKKIILAKWVDSRIVAYERAVRALAERVGILSYRVEGYGLYQSKEDGQQSWELIEFFPESFPMSDGGQGKYFSGKRLDLSPLFDGTDAEIKGRFRELGKIFALEWFLYDRDSMTKHLMFSSQKKKFFRVDWESAFGGDGNGDPLGPEEVAFLKFLFDDPRGAKVKDDIIEGVREALKILRGSLAGIQDIVQGHVQSYVSGEQMRDILGWLSIRVSLDSEERAVSRINAAADSAEAVETPGGIDLNARKMELEIDKQGAGAAMAIDPAMIQQFKSGEFSGVVPVILQITPVESLLAAIQ